MRSQVRIGYIDARCISEMRDGMATLMNEVDPGIHAVFKKASSPLDKCVHFGGQVPVCGSDRCQDSATFARAGLCDCRGTWSASRHLDGQPLILSESGRFDAYARIVWSCNNVPETIDGNCFNVTVRLYGVQRVR